MLEVLIIVVVVVVVGAVGLFRWYFSLDQRTRRAMKGIPLRRIEDVIEGEKARVVGRADVERPLRAPLSGRACAVWRVVIEEKRQSGKSSYWQTVIDEHEAVDFFVRDGAGKAKVDASFVRPVLERDADFRSGFLNDAGPELEAFLAERGRSSQGLLFNKTMRYREGVLEPGETVAVVGIGRWERDPDEEARAGDGYREARMPRRLVLSSPEEGPLLLSDEPEMTR